MWCLLVWLFAVSGGLAVDLSAMAVLIVLEEREISFFNPMVWAASCGEFSWILKNQCFRSQQLDLENGHCGFTLRGITSHRFSCVSYKAVWDSSVMLLICSRFEL